MKKKFYLLVAGSRTYRNYSELSQILDALLKNQITQHKHIVIVSGGANGTDEMAKKYADERGYKKHIMLAECDKFGKSAGYRRNNDMHKYIATPLDNERGCVCFWDKQSRGTKHNFKLSRDYGTPLRVFDTVVHKFMSNEEIQKYI